MFIQFSFALMNFFLYSIILHPLALWRLITYLIFSPCYWRWQYATKGLSHNPLRPSTIYFKIWRERKYKLYQFMKKKWQPNFPAMRHTISVSISKQIL